MPTQTLLDMTQEILSAMSSDEVNSISDTTESLQVAMIIKRSYFDMVARAHLPEHEQLIQLTPSNDPDMPVLMLVPAEVNNIQWIKYFDDTEVNGGADGYKYVTVLPIQQFIEIVSTLNPTETGVQSFTFTDAANNFPGNYTFYYRNDRQPCYCTIIGNQYVIFDSLNENFDTTLQASKVMAFGQVAPQFLIEDDFIPRLDDKLFPLLVNSAKALAFYELKQMPHSKAEQEVKRQWSSAQKNKSTSGKPTSFDQLPDYGRRGIMNSNRRWWNGWGN